MSNQFKALILNQEGENFSREIKSIEKNFLKDGDVTVKVQYSGLNYKDALILKNGARLVKEFPHIPGIDFSGIVEESKHKNFKSGDEIILTGWRVGEIYFGGYSQYAKVNGDFLVKKPKNLDLRQSMILGTAGLTALMCSFTAKATREELLLGEKVENVVVSGACNIFMTYENEIYTPSLEENILPGVTREFFISSLQKRNINVKQVDCPVSFLDSVSTIWFTSSTRGAQPIKSILNHGYEMDPNDALFRNAKEAFTNSIRDYFQDH